jgi:hypothetical protein
MTRADAIDYLAGTSQIPVRDMSKAMFQFLRACSRAAGRQVGYDSHFTTYAARTERMRFYPADALAVRPQSPALRAKIVSKIADPLADPFALFGV